MPRASPRFRHADVKRAISAAKACGLTVSGVRVDVDGAITISTSETLTTRPLATSLKEWRDARPAKRPA